MSGFSKLALLRFGWKEIVEADGGKLVDKENSIVV